MSNINDYFKHLFNIHPHKRGKIFERSCKWFLENDPIYAVQLRKVWLWKDWPDNWGRDKGIDLIAQTHTGELWAIQAKCYDKSYYVTKEDVDKFLSESSRTAISYRLLICTTDRLGDNAREVISAQEKQVGICSLKHLLTSSLDWLSSVGDLQPLPVRKPKTPRPHQENAIRSVLNGFKTYDKGQLYMACGTGKTLVGLWIAEALKSQNTLVLVPSISLVSQLYQEWVANATTDFIPIFVCSDPTVSEKDQGKKDQMMTSLNELGFPTTTDPEVILNYFSLTIGTPKVIFSTYHSSPVIKKLCALDKHLTFDITIADEAHHCTGGNSYSNFCTITEKDAISTKRKLFMTATPKIMTNRLKTIAHKQGYDTCSMDDEKKFGPVVYKLPFSEAIKQGLLCDYQVIITGKMEDKYLELVRNRRLITISDIDHQTDAGTLASQLLVAKAMHQYNLQKIITFHSTQKNAEGFINSFPEAVNCLDNNERPQVKFLKAILGNMTHDKRNTHIKDFEEYTSGIVANVRCLTEGIDIPILDAVAFIDPKESQVDIIQAVGRAIRKDPNNKNKEKGYILVPVFSDSNGIQEDAEYFDRSCFHTVWEIIRALRAHDDTLAAELDQFRLQIGKKTCSNYIKEKIHIDLPVELDGKAFSHSFLLKMVDECSIKWRPHEQARAWARALKLNGKADWERYVKGILIGRPKLPDDIPRTPSNVYSNCGWVSWGNFLGTGNRKPCDNKYRSFEKAREFARTLKLRNGEEWRKFAKTDNRPEDIPADPYQHYKDKGWAGWGDFLGTWNPNPHGYRYQLFEEARVFARSLHFANVKQWNDYVKSGKKPKDIPSKPDRQYKDKGWAGWGDFLGTGFVATFDRKYKNFLEAKKFARGLRLKSYAEWIRFAKSDQRPSDIPKHPQVVYSNKWKGWGDFLGTGYVANSKRKFLQFSEARIYARQLNFKGQNDWRAWANTPERPFDIPAAPDRTYKNKGWISWGDFLGTGCIANSKRKFLQFSEARTYARQLNFKGKNDWCAWAKTSKRPPDIAAAPDRTYKNKGWISWGDFLGTGNRHSQNYHWLSFPEARDYARSLKLSGKQAWIEWAKSKERPSNIPASPYSAYKHSGWIGWKDFLGNK